jgi:hypothetical protein
VSNLIVESGQLNTKALNYLEFDGDNDYIPIDPNGGDMERAADTTISMWINPDEIQNNVLMGDDAGSAHDEFRFKDNDGGIFRHIRNNTSFDHSSLSTDIVINKWQHFVYVMNYANGTDKIYLDGVLVSSIDHTDNQPLTLNWIGFGNNTAASKDNFDGSMRDVRIYDYELSADQVASLYRGSYPVTPKYWWKFEQGTGGTSDDFTDSGTAGTHAGDIQGATWVNGSLKVNGAARVLDNGSVL